VAGCWRMELGATGDVDVVMIPIANVL